MYQNTMVEEKDLESRTVHQPTGRNGPSGRGGHLNILDLWSSPAGLPSAIDLINNRVLHLAPGGVMAEAIGMTKAGRSWHLSRLTKRLTEDQKVQEILGGRSPIVVTLKPNSIAKNLFEKDPNYRADFNEYICNSHRNVSLEVRMPQRQNVRTYYADIILWDRAFYDDVFWIRALNKYGLIEDNLIDRHLEICDRSIKERLMDIVFGIHVPPAVALERERKRREEEFGYKINQQSFGKVMDQEFLAVLHEGYMRAEREERIRRGLQSSLQKGEITEEDYKEQTKGFIIQCEYISVDGTAKKEDNHDKIYSPFRSTFLKNHGVSEELEYRLGQS